MVCPTTQEYGVYGSFRSLSGQLPEPELNTVSNALHYEAIDSHDAFKSVIYLERGLFGAPMWIRLRCGFGLGLLVGGLEWIYG
jgi:hypothetical protein